MPLSIFDRIYGLAPILLHKRVSIAQMPSVLAGVLEALTSDISFWRFRSVWDDEGEARRANRKQSGNEIETSSSFGKT